MAAGDLMRLPYIVMEYIEGETLQRQLDNNPRGEMDDITLIGNAMALAAHGLHQQNVCHLDLSSQCAARGWLRRSPSTPELSSHAHYPDLLAEELRHAVGSPAWIAPEQIVGVRGDVRSDIFAIGVMLYEMATGELPFGAPTTRAGCASGCG